MLVPADTPEGHHEIWRKISNRYLIEVDPLSLEPGRPRRFTSEVECFLIHRHCSTPYRPLLWNLQPGGRRLLSRKTHKIDTDEENFRSTPLNCDSTHTPETIVCVQELRGLLRRQP